MASLQDFGYAMVQVVHNFGAVAVVGGAIAGLYAEKPGSLRRKFAWLTGIGWAAQASSGAGFGAISYYYYGQFPDIHGIAIAALIVKMLCAATGFVTAAFYLRYAASWPIRMQRAAWQLLVVLGTVALTAAAFLRWFS
ncbi:MAG: hypothetical protein OEV35_06140 [Gallionellaceae bacterium]|nr:hypothetical protein [Gallionellaceae bacterium]